MIVLVLLILFLTICYFWVKQNYQYWQKRGVVGPKPSFLVGNLGQAFILKTSPGEVYTNAYNNFKEKSIVGLYRAFTPILLIRDPELLKELTIKSFNHFHDNDIFCDKKTNPLFGRNPFCLRGEEWKIVRAQLTPAFTSGKMKILYPSMEANAQKMVQFVLNQAEATNGQGYEAKELATRFTLNNVGDAVFGVEAKCFEEKNSEFQQLANEFLSPGSWAMLMLFLTNIMPVLTKIFPIKFCPKSVENKLFEIVSQSLKYREDNNIVRNDFLQIISQLKNTSKDYEFTDLDVTAHAAGFFGDGYETSSLLMSFVLFCLADNPEKQAELRNEIVKSFDNSSNLPYEVLQTLPYLDAVINETARLHPVVYSLHKICTEDYTFTPKESNRPLTIEKNTPIVLPVWGLQHDPLYFEKPESFIPERFLGQNLVQKCTFLPFGEGPRACLGQRFGVLQIKTGVAYLIKNFELKVNKKTQVPLKYDPTNIMITPIGGLWLDFKKL